MKIGTDMKYNYLILAIAGFTLLSCAREKVETPETITIRAYQEGATETRTTLIDGGTQVYWEPSDEIKVFFNGSGARFVSQNTENVTVATFSGMINVVAGANEGASSNYKTWGVYPYRADATSDGVSVTTTLTSAQIGRSGSFAKNTFITLAQSDGLNLAFYNVTGGLRFSLTQEGVKEVVFEGLNNEDIAGKVKLAFADGVPVVQEVIDGQKSITLTAPSGGTFETGKWYYIVTLPGSLSNGFKMTFNTENQYATLKSADAKTIKRGIFGSLENADEDLIYKDKGGDVPQTGNIVFADPAAKYACVAKFDTNGDGEVSYEEAEAATSFSGLFTDWKGVVSFDEIRYFKNVHSLSGVFRGCTKLVSITVPESITDLGTSAFGGCSSLTSVELPSGITTIGNSTFGNCYSLGSIDIPSNVTSIGQSAFFGCSSLATVKLPSGVTAIADNTFEDCRTLVSVDIPSNVASIGKYAFNRCYALSSIDLPPLLKTIGEHAFSYCEFLTRVVIPAGVTSLGIYAFEGCSSLTTVNIPSGVTHIPGYCFKNCTSLTSVTISEGVTSIDYGAFEGVKMWKLDLPSSITSIGGIIGQIACVILPSTSPVSIQSGTFSNVSGIFVPSNLIDMYGALSVWAEYSSKLHPIDTYREKNEYTLVTSGAVDMGTSVKWAAYNLGATRPEEYGDYYDWGEIQTKANYGWSTYKWCNGDYIKLTKYCPVDRTDYWDGSGTPDGKTVLDPADDAAHAIWGEAWRLATYEEWKDLRESCVCEITTHKGINGVMFYSVESGNSIFLPAAGYREKAYLAQVGSDSGYWSSSLNTSYPYRAWYLNAWYSDNSHFGISLNYRDRYIGLSIRPVCD